jgi:hypothetical protein
VKFRAGALEGDADALLELLPADQARELDPLWRNAITRSYHKHSDSFIKNS